MKFSEINLTGQSREQLKTEIFFSVASERASGVEVVRFNITPKDEDFTARAFTHSVRILKGMKENRAVQFLATPQSFENSEREASFLINKYPELFSDFTANSDVPYIYVKI